MNGFIITLPSSRGEPCFFVHPSRFGDPVTRHYPWGRSTFVATVFPTQEVAQAALDEMKGIHQFIAPEVNGGLSKRLDKAQVVGANQVTGIELEIP